MAYDCIWFHFYFIVIILLTFSEHSVTIFFLYFLQPEQVPLDETMIVSKYISNPLTIDGMSNRINIYFMIHHMSKIYNYSSLSQFILLLPFMGTNIQ